MKWEISSLQILLCEWLELGLGSGLGLGLGSGLGIGSGLMLGSSVNSCFESGLLGS